MRRFRSIATALAVLLAALLLAACASESDSAGPKDEQEPEPKPETKVLVEHDFEDPKSTAWVTGVGGAVNDDGVLVLDAGPDEVAYSGASKDIEVDDVHVSVAASSDDIESDEAAYGVLCRWTFDPETGDSKDYYAFTISPNGYAAISTANDFLWETAKPIEAINTGSGVVNEIRAECIGDQLTLYVNDEKVKTITDETHSRGDVGVALENYGKKKVTAELDDFVAEQVL